MPINQCSDPAPPVCRKATPPSWVLDVGFNTLQEIASSPPRPSAPIIPFMVASEISGAGLVTLPAHFQLLNILLLAMKVLWPSEKVFSSLVDGCWIQEGRPTFFA